MSKSLIIISTCGSFLQHSGPSLKCRTSQCWISAGITNHFVNASFQFKVLLISWGGVTMNRWKFMFHKIMLHSVPPSNFRDNSSTLVISSPFKLAPFFLRIWYKIVLCERICKMINVWIYLVELWLRNGLTSFVNFSFNWKSHLSVLPTQSYEHL